MVYLSSHPFNGLTSTHSSHWLIPLTYSGTAMAKCQNGTVSTNMMGFFQLSFTLSWLILLFSNVALVVGETFIKLFVVHQLNDPTEWLWSNWGERTAYTWLSSSSDSRTADHLSNDSILRQLVPLSWLNHKVKYPYHILYDIFNEVWQYHKRIQSAQIFFESSKPSMLPRQRISTGGYHVYGTCKLLCKTRTEHVIKGN